MAYFLINQYRTEPVLQQTSSSQLSIQTADVDSLQVQSMNLQVLKDSRSRIIFQRKKTISFVDCSIDLN